MNHSNHIRNFLTENKESNTEFACSSDDDSSSEDSSGDSGPVLSTVQVLHYLSILEGEIQARDLLIAALGNRLKGVMVQEEPMFSLLRDYHYISCNKARNEQGNSTKLEVYAKEILNRATAYEDSSFKTSSILDKHRFLYSKVSSYVCHLEEEHVKTLAEFKAFRENYNNDILKANKSITAMQNVQQQLLHQLQIKRENEKNLKEKMIELNRKFCHEKLKNNQLKTMFMKDRESLMLKLKQGELSSSKKIAADLENHRRELQDLNSQLVKQRDSFSKQLHEYEDKIQLFDEAKQRVDELKVALTKSVSKVESLKLVLDKKNAEICNLRDRLAHATNRDKSSVASGDERITEDCYKVINITDSSDSILDNLREKVIAHSETLKKSESLSFSDVKGKCAPQPPKRVSSLLSSNESVNLIKVTMIKEKSNSGEIKRLDGDNIIDIPSQLPNDDDVLARKMPKETLGNRLNQIENSDPFNVTKLYKAIQEPILQGFKINDSCNYQSENLSVYSTSSASISSFASRTESLDEKVISTPLTLTVDTIKEPQIDKLDVSGTQSLAYADKDFSVANEAFTCSDSGSDEEFEKMLILSQISDGILQKTVMSPIHVAVLKGDLSYLNALLREGSLKSLVNLANNDGTTPVHIASATGQIECLRILLQYGGNANALRDDNVSPLHVTAMKGYADCARILLEFGANALALDKAGWTPLYIAATNGYLDCLRLFLSVESFASLAVSHPGGWSILHGTVRYNQVEALKTLLQHIFLLSKEDDILSLINKVDEDGWSPESLSTLLSTGKVEFAVADKWGRIAIDVATPECCEILSKYAYVKLALFVNGNIPSLAKGNSYINIAGCNITIDWTWDVLDKFIDEALRNYSVSLSAGYSHLHEGAIEPLFLSSKSIWHYQCGIFTWVPGESPSCEGKNPFEFFRAYEKNFIDQNCKRRLKCSKLFINLKGFESKCLDRLEFESLIPVPILEKYLTLIRESKSVIFYGPPGTGKIHLVTKLAQFIKHDGEPHKTDIIRLSMCKSFRRRDIIEFLYKRQLLVPSNYPIRNANLRETSVIILDNLAQISLCSLFGELLATIDNRGPSHPVNIKPTQIILKSDNDEVISQELSGEYFLSENVYILGTLDRNDVDVNTQKHFQWIQFQFDREPVSGLLIRYFNRKIIHINRGVFPGSNVSVKQTVDWICLCWKRLNLLLSKLGLQQLILGPRHFFTCASDLFDKNGILKWMSLCWNHAIASGVEDAVVHKKNFGSAVPEQVASSILWLLLCKAVIPDCPVDTDEKLRYFSGFRAFDKERAITAGIISSNENFMESASVKLKKKSEYLTSKDSIDSIKFEAETNAPCELLVDKYCFTDIARKVLEILHIYELLRITEWNDRILSRLASIALFKAEDRLRAVFRLSSIENPNFIHIFIRALKKLQKQTYYIGILSGKNCTVGIGSGLSGSLSSLDSLTESKISSESSLDGNGANVLPLNSGSTDNSRWSSAGGADLELRATGDIVRLG